jgi:uncharacterized OB-fold protein
MTASETYLPDEMTVLFPSPSTQEFWDRCARQELAFQRCTECGAFRNPPVPVCHRCRSASYEYAPIAGRGTVYSFTVVTHALAPTLAPYVPYNVALIEFDDAPGVRLVSNVVDAAPEELVVGMPVELQWEVTGAGATLPRFRKAT